MNQKCRRHQRLIHMKIKKPNILRMDAEVTEAGVVLINPKEATIAVEVAEEILEEAEEILTILEVTSSGLRMKIEWSQILGRRQSITTWNPSGVSS